MRHIHSSTCEHAPAAHSRRRFLQSAAAAAGALAAPAILPASALGLEGATPPGDRIGIGMIGMGKKNFSHLRNLLATGSVQVLALCDVESIRLKQAQAETEKAYAEKFGKASYSGCAIHGDFREMLARDDIDAIVISTPNHWHAIMAIEAMRAGKDVYCEKPLALTIREARAIVDAAARYNRVFQVGSQQRSERAFRLACEIVRNGLIGEIRTVETSVGGPPKDDNLPPEETPPTLDWDMWLGPAPSRPYNKTFCPMDPVKSDWARWRDYRDFAGGPMTDWGAHHFDIAQWGLGMDHSGPVEVAPPNGRDLDRLEYRYANGVLLHREGASRGAAVEFIGTKGKVACNRGQYLRTEPANLKDVVWGPGDIRLYESVDQKGNWLECIRTRKQTICPAEIGCRTVTVCHIGNIAYWLNRPLKWDPAAEQFVGDDEANRLLERPMRPPWRI
ncbi:MAG: Inositol 2-dehydrogenase [candidate division BRC1 bacterium ADurb.BinA364]|nr:MAG: Inositol 2-dehydrogenase [candidate division BRC1 bacterium ADurb.BinA364]